MEKTVAWAIQNFLMGDGIHTQPFSVYLGRLPEKLDALAFNLDPRHPRIFLPLLFLAGLIACVFNRKRWGLKWQKSVLLFLVFADLMVFQMPFGNAFYDPSKIPQPAYPAPENRSLVLLLQNTSPLPAQYGEMAYPNMNFVSGRPNLVIDANPGLARYDKLAAEVGWFSWVYKGRNPIGFAQNVDLLQKIGVDQIVTDTPLNIPVPFRITQKHYPYTYSLPETFPKARLELIPNGNELPPSHRTFPPPEILKWDETQLLLITNSVPSAGLLLQKTFLPGWKVLINSQKSYLYCYNFLLIGVDLPKGKNQVELKFEPTGLRLGFFLFFLLFSTLVIFLFSSRLA